MKRSLIRILSVLFILLRLSDPVLAVETEEHIVEKGETALQIAIDHNLTMEQLILLNPGTDLEMMKIGDKLIVPPENFASFDDYLKAYYAESLRVSGLHCDPRADGSASCFFSITNTSDRSVGNLIMKVSCSDQNGREEKEKGYPALIQVQAGETLPMVIPMEGPFSGTLNCEAYVKEMTSQDLGLGTFRVSPELYSIDETRLPGDGGAVLALTFTPESAAKYAGKTINILAAIYDAEEQILGIRSVYGDFSPEFEITVYKSSGVLDHSKVWIEIYE